MSESVGHDRGQKAIDNHIDPAIETRKLEGG
jgi:hypothetical protein